MYSVIQFPFVDARLLPMAIFILGLYPSYFEFLGAEKLHMSSSTDFSFYSIFVPLSTMAF